MYKHCDPSSRPLGAKSTLYTRTEANIFKMLLRCLLKRLKLRRSRKQRERAAISARDPRSRLSLRLSSRAKGRSRAQGTDDGRQTTCRGPAFCRGASSVSSLVPPLVSSSRALHHQYFTASPPPVWTKYERRGRAGAPRQRPVRHDSRATIHPIAGQAASPAPPRA